MGIVYVLVVIRMRKHFYLGVEGYHVSNDDNDGDDGNDDDDDGNDDDDDGNDDDHLLIGGVEGSHARG